VLAAASLAGPFADLGAMFEEANPGVTVTFSFDGSSTLASQIQEGAPADVFASADQATMDKVVAAGLAGSTPVVLTANAIVAAVPVDNPGKVETLGDLTEPRVTTVLCAAEVPCGAAARRVFDAAGITVSPVSEEQSVKAVVTRLSLGEADAGMVYQTDVAASQGALTAVPLPDDQAVQAAARTDYPIVVVRGSADADLAARFIAFVTSEQGQQVLRDAGFQTVR